MTKGEQYTAHNNEHISEILTLYDYHVNYHLEGIKTKDFIRQDKQLYYQRWPVVEYKLDDEIAVQDLPDNEFKVVTFTTSFNVYNPEKENGIKGKALNTIKIRLINGDLKIIDEKQQVLSRKKY